MTENEKNIHQTRAAFDQLTASVRDQEREFHLLLDDPDAAIASIGPDRLRRLLKVAAASALALLIINDPKPAEA